MNLEQRANQVRNIVIHQCSRKDKEFLGGPPYSNQIISGLDRYEHFLESKSISERKRVNFASVCNDLDGNVIGYQSTTIVRDSQPTEYEKQNIGLYDSLTYGIMKYIVVNPDYRNGTVARPLLVASLETTAFLGVCSWVTDVNAENRPMQLFMRNHGIQPIFTWITPNKTNMVRMGTSDITTVLENINRKILS